MPKNTMNYSSPSTYHRLFTYLPAMVVGICLLIFGIYADHLNSRALKQELRHSVLDQLSVIRARLEGNINSNALLVRGLAAAISVEPDISKERFASLSKYLLQGHSQLRNIGAAPDLVIRYMYPVEGNEAAIGLNYREKSDQFDAVKRARDSGKLVLAGPVNLVQGGQGFIARVPVFIDAEVKNGNKFWGIISAVIDVEKFYMASGLYGNSQTVEIAIRGKDALGSQGELFFGRKEIFASEPVLVDIALPHGLWQMAAIPKGGWSQHASNFGIFRITLVTIGLLILLLLLILGRFMEKKRESEVRLRGLFELSPVGIALNDYDTGAFIEVNEALLSPSGYTLEEFVKLSYWDVTPKEYKAQDTVQLENMEKSGRYGPYEKELIRKDGSRYPVLLNGIAVYDSSGKKMIWSIIEDISARKQTEESLRRSQKMDAIGQLTGGIAHDFNNILGVILGNLELLKRQISADDDKAHQRMEAIKKAGQRAADLTKQLLSFSGNRSAQQTVTNINQLIDSMENLIVRSVTPEVEVEHKFADELWLTKIDPGDFEDTMLNLSINARDAMAGHGHITLETRNVTLETAYCDQIPEATPGDYVEFSVSDNGEGIPLEQQQRIFEPFYTTKEQGKGTGLGLSMVYGFVQRSGGFINIYSKVGIGTTFKLYLPRFKGEEQPAKQSGVQSEILSRGTETLLVVDDETDLLEMARESLEIMGYRVLTASDGRQALERLAEEPAIDLLFSDVVMPGGINGYELAEQAADSRPELKVLLTSGYTGKAVALGQSRFTANLLSKPYSQVELASRVRAILDGVESIKR